MSLWRSRLHRVLIGALFGLRSTILMAADGTQILPTEISQDSIPPEGGRSLFDHLMITKQPNGTWQYSFNEPDPSLPPEVRKKKYFEVFLDQIVARAGGKSISGVKSILIPGGRSLQRSDGDLLEPRRVVAFNEHFAGAKEMGLTLYDRIFIGHSPHNNQIEVISYNEIAGRYEFQLVTDFGIPGKKPVVRYANRAVCSVCHQTQTPIFPPSDWEESNSRPIVVESIKWANKGATSLDGKYSVVNLGGIDEAYAVNNSVLRARDVQFMQIYWQKGCRIVPEQARALGLPAGYRSEDCRAQIASFALLNLINTNTIPKSLPNSAIANGPTGVPYLPITELLKLLESNLKPLEYKYVNIKPRDPYKKVKLPGSDAFIDVKNFVASEALFKNVDQMVKADVGEGPFLSDASVAPNRTIPEDIFPGDARPVRTGLDIVIARLKEMFTDEQKDLMRNKGGLTVATGPATIVELYKTLRNSAAFADKPLRRGLFVEAVLDGLKVKPEGAVNSCCSNVDGFPPVVLTDDTTHLPGLSSERQILQQRCFSCHSQPNSKLGYLAGTDQNMPDKTFWQQVLSREIKWNGGQATGLPARMDLCQRINWTLPASELPIPKRMPASSTLRKPMRDIEVSDVSKSERKIVMDAIKAKLQEVGQESDSSSRQTILQTIIARAATPAEQDFWKGLAAAGDPKFTAFGTLMTKIALESTNCSFTPMKAEDPL